MNQREINQRLRVNIGAHHLAVVIGAALLFVCLLVALVHGPQWLILGGLLWGLAHWAKPGPDNRL